MKRRLAQIAKMKDWTGWLALRGPKDSQELRGSAPSSEHLQPLSPPVLCQIGTT